MRNREGRLGQLLAITRDLDELGRYYQRTGQAPGGVSIPVERPAMVCHHMKKDGLCMEQVGALSSLSDCR